MPSAAPELLARHHRGVRQVRLLRSGALLGRFLRECFEDADDCVDGGTSGRTGTGDSFDAARNADPAERFASNFPGGQYVTRKQRNSDAGCDEFHTKPIDLPSLLEKIGRLVPG